MLTGHLTVFNVSYVLILITKAEVILLVSSNVVCIASRVQTRETFSHGSVGYVQTSSHDAVSPRVGYVQTTLNGVLHYMGHVEPSSHNAVYYNSGTRLATFHGASHYVGHVETSSHGRSR